jgi:hypothetical protein
MNYFIIFIYSILIIKILYLLFIFFDYYLKYNLKKNPFDMKLLKRKNNTEQMKNILEKFFTLSIALLLIILFYPHNSNKIIVGHETKQLLCLFGVVLIIKELGIIS